jgi:predicted nucleotidyltransferase
VTRWYGAPEDIILKKMEAYQEGGSEKHLRDVAGMLKVMKERIDRSYIEQEASSRGYSDVWQAILRRLGH